MKNLYQILPSPAPDYSGVSSMLFEMDILTVFIDPHGCNGQTLHYSEPRYRFFNHIPKSFSFSVREIDAITGVDNLLVKKIKSALQYVPAKAIALVGAPVPMIISTDFRSLAEIVEKDTNLPTIALSTNGLSTYESGQKKALEALIDKFSGHSQSSASMPYDVHILGATPLDGWDDTAIMDYVELLKECGANSVICWGHGGDIDAISTVDHAKLLIAVSNSGIHAARKIYEKYHIPYIIGFPVGKKNTEEFCSNVKNFFTNNVPFPENTYNKPESVPNKKSALIIADQITGNALRDCLESEYSYDHVDVVSYFSLDENLTRENDIHLCSEDALLNFYTMHSPYDIVIGDPVYQDLLPHECHFIPNPHPAISGILYWNQCSNYLGIKGNDFFNYYLP